jgi:hypothetical protein
MEVFPINANYNKEGLRRNTLLPNISQLVGIMEGSMSEVGNLELNSRKDWETICIGSLLSRCDDFSSTNTL